MMCSNKPASVRFQKDAICSLSVAEMRIPIILSTLIALIALSHTALAQIPDPISTQSVPTLQEWWRADNMGYGIEGATWLDDFPTKGTGVLVVSTPKGVQSWQLRFPWDTVNVFTWAGNNANIKTGDFNGDGVKDYIDANGRIYKGSKDGFPILTTQRTAFPSTIGDFNNDGKDDIFHLRDLFAWKFELGTVYFGNELDDTLRSTVINRSAPFDTLWATLNCYTRQDNGLGIIMCGRPFKYDNQGNAFYRQEGYKLFSVKFDKGAFVPSVSALDSILFYSGKFDGKQVVRGFTSIHIAKDTRYLLSIEIIGGQTLRNNLSIYQLDRDSIKHVLSYRKDTLGLALGLQHSIDNDNIPDIILASGGVEKFTRTLFSGNLQSKQLNPLYAIYGHTLSGYHQIGLSVRDFSGDGIADLVIPSVEDTLTFLRTDKTVSVPDELLGIDDILSPNPLSRTGVLTLRLLSLNENYVSIIITDNTGKRVLSRREFVQGNTVTIPLIEYHLSAGAYTVIIQPDGGLPHSYPLIIE
jgi:hypothetical protein